MERPAVRSGILHFYRNNRLFRASVGNIRMFPTLAERISMKLKRAYWNLYLKLTSLGQITLLAFRTLGKRDIISHRDICFYYPICKVLSTHEVLFSFKVRWPQVSTTLIDVPVKVSSASYNVGSFKGRMCQYFLQK